MLHQVCEIFKSGQSRCYACATTRLLVQRSRLDLFPYSRSTSHTTDDSATFVVPLPPRDCIRRVASASWIFGIYAGNTEHP